MSKHSVKSSHIQQKYINNFDFCIVSIIKIRIYFMSFIVQISPFVHLFTLNIVFRWGLRPPEPPTRALPWTCWSLKPPDPSPQVVPTFHFIPSYAPDCSFSWYWCYCCPASLSKKISFYHVELHYYRKRVIGHYLVIYVMWVSVWISLLWYYTKINI